MVVVCRRRGGPGGTNHPVRTLIEYENCCAVSGTYTPCLNRTPGYGAANQTSHMISPPLFTLASEPATLPTIVSRSAREAWSTLRA